MAIDQTLCFTIPGLAQGVSERRHAAVELDITVM
jgi:hypothetical protein